MFEDGSNTASSGLAEPTDNQVWDGFLTTELIEWHRRAPELGPEMVVFSGGTAFNETARVLKTLTQHSTHLLTPFDSGGSSAALRIAFDMPAVGDLRSRLMALADESLAGHQRVVKLFQTRIPSQIEPAALALLLRGLKQGNDRLLTEIAPPIQGIVMALLNRFFADVPDTFDYRGASLGNLVLTGAYLEHHRRMDPTAALFSRLVKTEGAARLIVDQNLHLGARLKNGEVVLGQHRMTGKETAPLTSPIAELFINRGLEREVRAEATAKRRIRDLIETTGLIVYAPGSFYTSLLANLLPTGITESICNNPNAPRVWIPNLGVDPEQFGMTTEDALHTLLETLAQGTPGATPQQRISHILVDEHSAYAGGIPTGRLKELGIELVTAPLTGETPDRYCPEKLSAVLIALATATPT